MVCRFVQRGTFAWAAFAGIAIRLSAADTQPAAAPLSYHVTRYTAEEGLPQNTIKALHQTRDGYLWIGTESGLCQLRPNAVRVYARENGLRTLYEDRFGRIWAGFDRCVAWINEAGAVQELPHALSHSDVRVIHQDRSGDLWFGTYGGGLNRLRDGQIAAYATPLGEYNNRAWCIHEDTDGVFWVGTRNGLNRFVPPGVPSPGLPATLPPSDGERGGFFTFTTRHGLHENIINNVQEDDFGYLWLSGLQGIYRVSRRELNEVAAGGQAQAQVLAFGEADGMLNSQCNGGVNQPSGCKDRAGRIWFPTARGVAMVDPRTIRRNGVPPPVVIEQVIADDEVIFGDGMEVKSGVQNPESKASASRVSNFKPATLNYQLAPGRARVLAIHYPGNSFAAPNRMRFKCRLEGYDRDWRYDDYNRRVAFYTSLRPGAYTFRVTACNNHGVWSATPAYFSFTLAPHFWQTWLFYVLTCAVVTGLAATVQAYRLRCRLELPSQMPAHLLSSPVRYQVFLVVKEALHNLVQHAGATEARLRIEQVDTELSVTVADNGCGLMRAPGPRPGHGLDNMKNRVAGLGGRFSIVTTPGEGTRVDVAIPLEPGRTEETRMP